MASSIYNYLEYGKALGISIYGHRVGGLVGDVLLVAGSHHLNQGKAKDLKFIINIGTWAAGLDT